MPRRSACAKVPYRSRAAARAALKLLRARGMHHYYRCTDCRDYHLSSNKGR